MYKRLVEYNERAVEQGRLRQDLDPMSRYYGGTIDPSTGLAWVNHTTGTPTEMCYWGTALVNPDSIYYRDEKLLKQLLLATEFVLRFQHSDGSISPGWTNFHSPPDTAFVVVGYAQLYLLLEQHDWKSLAPVLSNMRKFLEGTAPTLLTGGCHTPNHRWVMCAALAFIHKLFGIKEAVERIDQWLAEGMDITPDGEWTERSNGIYSPVSNIMLIHTALILNRPQLLLPVRLNLRMMMYLVHPGGEIVTDYSGRQDVGRIHTLSPYYLPYTIMAKLDQDAQFAGMASMSATALTDPGICSVNVLLWMLLNPEIQQPFITIDPPPSHYEKIINGEFLRGEYLLKMETSGHYGRIFHSRLHTDFGAPIARIRDGLTSVTLMTETPSFFSLRHGPVRLLGVQIASYFYPGYVHLQEMKKLPDGYRLTGEQKKGYYGPLAETLLPETSRSFLSPWYLLPHQSRPVTHEQLFTMETDVTHSDNCWTIRIKSSEPKEVMTQISFLFGDEGNFVSGDLLELSEGCYCWKGDKLKYTSGTGWVELTGGELGHRAHNVSNTILQKECKIVSVNLVTPFDKTFTVTLSP